MAVRYAVANGNWSAVGTWDGGASLPTVGDDVYANGFTVTVNQDITVTKISTEVCPSTGIVGGRFSTNAARNIIANVYAGTSYCLYVISGSVVIGNVYGGSSTSAYGILLQNYGTTTVIGNVYGGSASEASGIYTYYCFYLTVTGNVFGGNNASAYGINMNLASNPPYNLTITGNVTADVAPAIYGMKMLTITGIVTASNYASAVLSSAIQLTSFIFSLDGSLVNSINYMAVVGYQNFKLNPSCSTAWLFYDSDDVQKPLYTADVLENPPAESDVRSGIVYGIGDVYEGTLAVSPTTPADFIAALKADDLGKRMGKCATTEEVDLTVAAFNT